MKFGLVIFELYLNCCAAGVAKAEQDKLIPFMLTADTELMAYVTEGAPKKPICLSELACDTTSSSGVTEMNVVDHDLVPALDAPLTSG